MAATLDLRSLKLRSGEQYEGERDVPVEPFQLGGQSYVPDPSTVRATLTVTRASSGTTFELDFRVHLEGPCFRCLDEAGLNLRVRAREYHATNPEGDKELVVPYVHDDRLDVAAWARDAIALKLPEQIVCRADCAGLCGVCGRNLNDEPHEHEVETSDPRWAALAELRDKL